MVVIANSVVIALEQHYRLEKIETPTLKVLENCFLAVYIVELLLRLLCDGLQQLLNRAVLFDVLVVAISVMVQWFNPSPDFDELRPLMVVRIARLARVMRSVRLIMLFRELWQLVQGLLSSAGVMFYTLVLLCIILFAFALIGVELITVPNLGEPSPDPVIDGIIEQYFSNLWLTMLTLTQFVTLDSIAQIYRPLIVNDPFLAVYFLSAILTIGIVLMNLITAVLVEGAMECAEQNKEATRMYENKKKKNMLKELEKFFVSLDEDGSGKIDIVEAFQASEEMVNFIRNNIPAASLEDVFDHVDIDGDGELDFHEFCEGLYDAMTSQTPMELRRIEKRVQTLNVHVTELLAAQEDTLQRLKGISGTAPSKSQSSSLGARMPNSVDAAPQCVVGHASVLNLEGERTLLEPQEHPWALDTPAWGRQMLLELSMLREHVAKQPAVPCEDQCAVDIELCLSRESEFCSPKTAAIANACFDCAVGFVEAPVSRPRHSPHTSAITRTGGAADADI